VCVNQRKNNDIFYKATADKCCCEARKELQSTETDPELYRSEESSKIPMFNMSYSFNSVQYLTTGLTFVGKGNFDGSVLHGVWIAVSGGGQEWVISYNQNKKEKLLTKLQQIFQVAILIQMVTLSLNFQFIVHTSLSFILKS